MAIYETAHAEAQISSFVTQPILLNPKLLKSFVGLKRKQRLASLLRGKNYPTP